MWPIPRPTRSMMLPVSSRTPRLPDRWPATTATRTATA
ncbi:hypothetical protein R2601_04603 [Salipiger bermudensis HTCC2601]|uniref:Uncharacterized protein n=1 Tax=Salipiger bermudensis (strain DSM 26914 / JCM 13377 / KCTC 12554 / HTCC2601) TaxID=314265 RepID=Q0FVS5_SALBH|nr:hypothetical protein R2601_04603 [Salipiger bermudensis HTCC2601]